MATRATYKFFDLNNRNTIPRNAGTYYIHHDGYMSYCAVRVREALKAIHNNKAKDFHTAFIFSQISQIETTRDHDQHADREYEYDFYFNRCNVEKIVIRKTYYDDDDRQKTSVGSVYYDVKDFIQEGIRQEFNQNQRFYESLDQEQKKRYFKDGKPKQSKHYEQSVFDLDLKDHVEYKNIDLGFLENLLKEESEIMIDLINNDPHEQYLKTRMKIKNIKEAIKQKKEEYEKLDH